MTQAMHTTSDAVSAMPEQQLARPLRVLTPLITADLEKAKEAAVPYYRAAGEKLWEAKRQLEHGQFEKWIKRNFDISPRTARYYMSLAHYMAQIGTAEPISSMNDFRRRHLGEDRPIIDTEAMREADLKRAEVRELQRKLALQVIDAGYKIFAAKLHPDKAGGSKEAMANLNVVRDRLKSNA